MCCHVSAMLSSTRWRASFMLAEERPGPAAVPTPRCGGFRPSALLSPCTRGGVAALWAGRSSGDGRLPMRCASRHGEVDPDPDYQQAEHDQPRPDQWPTPSLDPTVSWKRLGDDVFDVRAFGIHIDPTRQPAPGCPEIFVAGVLRSFNVPMVGAGATVACHFRSVAETKTPAAGLRGFGVSRFGSANSRP